MASGHGDELADGVVAALDIDLEALDGEELRHFAEHALGEQEERGVGALIGVAHGLALLHLVEQARHARVVAMDLDAEALQLGQDVGAAGLVGDQQQAAVADRLRRHVLVGARVLDHGRGMDAGLGGEGRGADIGRMPVRRAVEQLVEACARRASGWPARSSSTPMSKRSA